MADQAGGDIPGGSRKFYAALVDELMLFAEHVFRNSRRMKSDGAPEGTHRSSAAAQWAGMGIKVVRPAAADPECPTALIYLWRDFVEIASGLASGGFGPPVVTWEALDAWCRLTGTALEAWEARTLIRLGQRRAVIESEEGGGNGGQDHARAHRPH